MEKSIVTLLLINMFIYSSHFQNIFKYNFVHMTKKKLSLKRCQEHIKPTGANCKAMLANQKYEKRLLPVLV